MIRLIGFLVGSAVSIGMLLLILGIPDITLSREVIEQIDFDDVIEQIDLDSVPAAVEAIKANIEAIGNNMADEISEIVERMETEEAPTEQVVKMETEEPAPPLPPPLQDELVVETVSAPDPIIENDLRWYSFWNPFRSEIAANGFVTQLEKVTGLDYRVVKIKAGVYEVTFAYQNDTERRTKLSQISSATGLDLPDS
jgi:hypothetical protein